MAPRRDRESQHKQATVRRPVRAESAPGAGHDPALHPVLELQRLVGNQAVAQMLTQRQAEGRPIFRLFGKKKKKASDAVNQAYEQSGEVAEGSNTYFVLKAAVKTGTKTRGRTSMQELLGGGGGHSWIEVEKGPDFDSLETMADSSPEGKTVVDSIGGPTKEQITQQGHSTIGFYPDVTGSLTTKLLAKQLFSDLPGKLLEPEQASFAGKQRAEKGFAITDAQQAQRLFNLIEAHRTHPYNIMRYNCTDFVMKAAKAVGMSLGVTTNKLGMTEPTKLYKQLYKKAKLGDKSAKHTELTNPTGGRYDVKHLSKRSQKKLDKKQRKLGLQQPIPVEQSTHAEEAPAVDRPKHTVPGFIGFVEGGMTRPGWVIELTGVVKDGDKCEIIVKDMGDKVMYVYARDFEQGMGFPYPAA